MNLRSEPLLFYRATRTVYSSQQILRSDGGGTYTLISTITDPNVTTFTDTKLDTLPMAASFWLTAAADNPFRPWVDFVYATQQYDNFPDSTSGLITNVIARWDWVENQVAPIWQYNWNSDPEEARTAVVNKSLAILEGKFTFPNISLIFVLNH